MDETMDTQPSGLADAAGERSVSRTLQASGNSTSNSNREAIFKGYYQAQDRGAPDHQRLLSGSAYSSWQRFQQVMAAMAPFMAAYPPNGTGRRHLVDFGSGLGRYSEAWARNGWRVTGVDYMAEFVAECNQRAKASGLADLRYVQGSYEQVAPVAPEGCDALLSVGVFQNLDHPAAAIKQLAAAVARDGLVVIETINRRSWFQRLKRNDLIQSFDPDHFCQLWQAAGCQPLALVPIIILPQRWGFLTKALIRGARFRVVKSWLLSSLAHGFVLVARKR